MSRKKEKPSLKRNFNPLYRIEQKPCSPPKVVHALLLHAQEVLHVLSEVAENFEISSTLPHHLGPRGPVSGNGRTRWPEPNGSGRRGSAATGSGATMSPVETCTGNLFLVECLFYRKTSVKAVENTFQPRLYSSHAI
eukprot:scaffold115462_cov83-Phaeocystis_antarctica.AAC.1